MSNDKATFNLNTSLEKKIQAQNPLIPRKVAIYVGEYPIKTILKNPNLSQDDILSIFIEKSSQDIYKWIPKGYKIHSFFGFEDANIDTHFWYNVLPTFSRDTLLMESLKKKSIDNLNGAIIFSSVWDGVGSAALPSLIEKFKAQNIDSISIAILPSKIQPADAQFNTYAALKMCLATENSTVLILGRDQLENFVGVDRRGVQIKGNDILNYIFDIFLAKDSMVEEITELSRTFNIKLFTALAVTASSYKVYGSFENMLNAALLKPLLDFDLSTSSLLYVLVRMPTNLIDKLPRAKIELTITEWFKEKTNMQSIHVTEPIYTEDTSDRIDAVLLIGGFDLNPLFNDLDKKVENMKRAVIDKGYITEEWHVPNMVEEEKVKLEKHIITEEKPKKAKKKKEGKEAKKKTSENKKKQKDENQLFALPKRKPKKTKKNNKSQNIIQKVKS